jgi:hypothetical protein
MVKVQLILGFAALMGYGAIRGLCMRILLAASLSLLGNLILPARRSLGWCRGALLTAVVLFLLSAPSGAAAEPQPPVPVEFSLLKKGYVALVIEDAEGNRVRNLVAETFFEAGKHVIRWDGLDESLKLNKGMHGNYDVGGKLMPPGTYRVRGLVRDEVAMFYEFTPFSAGNPPWKTRDNSGGWLADHDSPGDVLYLPKKDEMLISAQCNESGDGLIWVSRDGKKRTGLRWVGGAWTGAARLALDNGPDADPDVQAYAASLWKKGELRLSAILVDETALPPTLPRTLPVLITAGNEWGDDVNVAQNSVGGLAAFNGLLVVSLPKQNRLEFVDAKAPVAIAEEVKGKAKSDQLRDQRQGMAPGKVTLHEPRGMAFDKTGRLHVLSGTELHSYRVNRGKSIDLADKNVLISAGLEAPMDLAIHDGQIFISDRGSSNQVKVFDMKGAFVKAIGTPGKTTTGPYDPTRMANPSGMAITPDGMLWVAESDWQIKRTSVYRIADGSFVRAFHGPTRYGGGGAIDPKDRTRFYYNGMEFAIDWAKGTDRMARIFRRPGIDEDRPDLLPPPKGLPERAIYREGRQYMTDAFNKNPEQGADPLSIYVMKDGVAQRVAAAGSFNGTPSLGADTGMLARAELPAKVKLDLVKDSRKLMFVWSDLNDDGRAQRDEIHVRFMPDKQMGPSFTLDTQLELMSANGFRLPVRRFTAGGAPVYDLAAATSSLPKDSRPGTQAIAVGDYVVLTGGPMQGFKDGKQVWTYPSKWPSLHAGHSIPRRAMEPGEMAGTTRLLGLPIRPLTGEGGEIWGINADPGMMYLLTGDGLFVATLGTDLVQGTPLNGPQATRGMKLEKTNFIGENFWPTINQLADGSIYLVCGKGESNFIRVEGLDSIRRFTGSPIHFTPEWRAQCEAYSASRAAKPAKADPVLKVGLTAAPPEVDGKLEDWSGADWHSVYQFTRGKGAAAVVDNYEAAVRVSGDTLYLAYRTPDPNLTKNAAAEPKELFKSGGAFDLMLGTDPNADPKRSQPVAGDLRFLAAEVNRKIMAGVFRPVDPPAKGKPVGFSSPWRTIEFDSVTDVSSQVKLKSNGGNYEVAIPLAALGLKPENGKSIRGDIGLLRGDGGETVQRLYWQNKETGLISDVPGEAELAPSKWGEFRFENR